MKKNFRKGSGQGPNESQSESKGKGQNNTRSRKPIKNARGLRDVLGLGDKPAPAARSSGPAGERSSTQRGKNAPAGRSFGRPPERSSESAGGAKAAPSKKLTYIMNFEPPPDTLKTDERPSRPTAQRQTPPAPRPEPAQAKPQQSSRGSSNNEKPQAPQKNRQQNPQKSQNKKQAKNDQRREQEKPQKSAGPTRSPFQSSRGDRDQSRGNERTSEPRNDYQWPKDRTKAPEEKAAVGSSKNSKGGETLQGIVKRHPDGFGFLIPDDPTHADVYISRQSMTGVMTNDRVEASVYKPKHQGAKGEDRFAGEITRVLTRSNKRIVGKYLPVDQKYGVILDEKSAWGADLRIAAKDSMDAKEGDLVAVEVTQYPGERREFTGVVTGLLGSSEDPMNDVLRVIHQAGIPTHFSQDAIDEARSFGGEVTEAEMKGREDLTETPLITIDGATARDFDDAIFVEQTGSGFRLVVAIADVSHYVKPGTPLDQEAYERGTSTYFPNHVNPMLPEELSNELCSLKPHVTRLCFACEMKLSFEGEIEKFRFFEAVMESKARVTYGEAQEVLDGGESQQRLSHVAEHIKKAADLAKILMQKRFREGSLDLEIPETMVVVDKSGETSDIIKSERMFAHRLIEELMLVTNICTARFMEENEIPGIYRVHEEPDPDNIKNLQRYLWNLGGNRSVTGGSLQKKLTKALQSMAGKPESQILNILTLRTMRQAAYSESNIGHFGLGFTQYSHFTSPIRRYPDLIAHRLIKSQIYPRYRSMAMTSEELASATTFLSGTEQRSVKAERNLISIKKARFIRKFIGEEFEGVISSVTKFGVFVLLRQYDVDGLVKLEHLGPDKFIFDDENLRLIGPRSGVRYTIGDLIKVRVVGADIDGGKVDFELAEPVQPRHVDDDDDDHGEHEHQSNDSDKRQGNSFPKSLKGGNGSSNSKKGKRFDPQKRGSSPDDRGGVRKERVSKRRRKN